MKKIIAATFGALTALISCSRTESDAFLALDRAIELQEDYDRMHSCLTDSLRVRFLEAQTDSVKWEAAHEMEKFTAYHNIDTCHRYVMHMLDLCGDDYGRKSTSEACYANILYKMDSLGTCLLKAFCHSHGIVAVDCNIFIVTLVESYTFSPKKVDCRYYKHQFPTL